MTGQRSGDEKDRRQWRAFWDELPGWVRTAFLGVSVAASSSFATKQFTPDQDVLMDEEDWRKVVREELAPMKSGFKAFIATQPDKVQVVVLRAMQRAEEKHKGAE